MYRKRVYLCDASSQSALLQSPKNTPNFPPVLLTHVPHMSRTSSAHVNAPDHALQTSFRAGNTNLPSTGVKARFSDPLRLVECLHTTSRCSHHLCCTCWEHPPERTQNHSPIRSAGSSQTQFLQSNPAIRSGMEGN